jgi:preprotein translocase subunit SecG
MSNYINLLATMADTVLTPTQEVVYKVLSITMIALMAISAVTAIVLILLQPSNSSGIDALGGSSETFFGKNKGKSIEEKMKRWTWICLAVLIVFSVAFFIVQNPAIWA